MLRAALAASVLLAACKQEHEQAAAPAPPAAPAAPAGADLTPDQGPDLTPTQIEQGRYATDWTQVVQLDTTGGGAPIRNPEKLEQIAAARVNSGPMFLPLAGGASGPSVLRVQILLDRVFFSPGEMDGHYGKNTAKAVYFFQQSHGLRPTARVDSATFSALARASGAPDDLIAAHQLTADEVKGPFIEIPENVQAQAQLPCSCYNSLSEKLGELFHISPDLLRQLNPGADLDNLAAGQTLNAPQVRSPDAAQGASVARIVVSGRGSFVQALDASGKILFHFPSTLGATYDPSPSGSFRVVSISQDPKWHYQPQLLATASDTAHEAMVPGGPNNRVGSVWMALSAPHYGIHGTNKPETIGYATSSGCVRLTNWDAKFLSHRIHEGVPVAFRDIAGRSGGQAYGDQGMSGASRPGSSGAAGGSAGRSATSRGNGAPVAGRRGRERASAGRDSVAGDSTE